MKATEAKFLSFLRESPQFVIPIYQRTYSWSEEECAQLWHDIIRVGGTDVVKAHFLGSIVYIENSLYQVSSAGQLLVIDGQQRLTTLTLILAALARHLETLGESNQEIFEGFSPRKIRNYYLVNPEETGEKEFKLILSQADKGSLMSIVRGMDQPSEPSIRIVENFRLFETWIEESKDKLSTLCKGIAKLMIVDIALHRDQDNPQLIFESMNSTGKELSQADLIRNYILMGLEPVLQTRLYGDYWRPMEVEFGQEAYAEEFDAFVRYYLTVKTGELPNVKEVYRDFKAYASQSGQAVEELVAEVREYSKYYFAVALGGESDIELKHAFQDLKELKANVAYPFLMAVYRDYKKGLLNHSEMVATVRLVESYVFRRAVCGIPTNSLNLTFSTLSRSMKTERYFENVQAQFLRLPQSSYRRFPKDEEFSRFFQTRDLYTFPRRSYWLRRIENHGRKERVQVEEYTIEHILPQNENLPAGWREALGANWEQVQETWLHTLGNLTLTAYNSEYKDRPFLEKRDMEKGFRESPLRLNQGLGLLEKWDEAAIRARAARLNNIALEVWSSPRLTDEVMAGYLPKKPAATYSIEDHPHLSSDACKDLFEELRREILALDSSITEEFLKLYVAYKAETNFVDIIPKARGLQLSLNMKFHQLEDPKGICRDTTGLGRWGNGDVEINLSNKSEIPYVMGLVRQSFQKQMEED